LTTGVVNEVRAFVRLRQAGHENSEVVTRLDALEKRVAGHDEDLQKMFAALRALLESPRRNQRRIGFGA
jgi:ferric-dicitrate binding protein FerR (iron transport regulator)